MDRSPIIFSIRFPDDIHPPWGSRWWFTSPMHCSSFFFAATLSLSAEVFGVLDRACDRLVGNRRFRLCGLALSAGCQAGLRSISYSFFAMDFRCSNLNGRVQICLDTATTHAASASSVS